MALKPLAGTSLRDLEYVEAVAELKHFGKAAARCNVSQPALSEQVQKLEGRLGVTIFERGRRQVSLTQAGERIVEQIGLVLSAARDLFALGAHGDVLSGALRIGAIETLGPYYLPFLLQLLKAEKPELDPRLGEGRTAALAEGLRHGRFDAIITAGPDMPGMASQPLFFEPFLLAVPPGHGLARRGRIDLKQLPLGELLLLEEGHCLRDQALALCGAAPRAMRHSTSLETLWHMVAAGEGISLLPALALAARPDLRARVSVRGLEEDAGRWLSLSWRISDPREARFRELAALLSAHPPPGLTNS
ncbi:LysR substrate-binding domain-containing protein [Acidocella sp.]|uniref:LysR substrate-binding domain-containing protein n=1 Tax=Acidocella sp. TaxID=50710 RepID=UPI003D01BF8E